MALLEIIYSQASLCVSRRDQRGGGPRGGGGIDAGRTGEISKYILNSPSLLPQGLFSTYRSFIFASSIFFSLHSLLRYTQAEHILAINFCPGACGFETETALWLQTLGHSLITELGSFYGDEEDEKKDERRPQVVVRRGGACPFTDNSVLARGSGEEEEERR